MKIYKIIITVLCTLFFINCSSEPAPQPGGPTEILNTFVEASKTKDIEAMKRALSKGTMSLIEQSAQKKNTSVDELLKNEQGTLVRELPETRNEKIEGDMATLEVKNVETGEFDEIPFVKEGGAWRLALDEIVEEINDEETSVPTVEDTSNSNASKPGGGTKPNAAANKPGTNKNQ
ncbi:MAG: hypothetical protein H0U96_08320 [Acidobacteria bacterium]|jgi:hypothetical protein|nr:hypothetical protein [Acidobacteriota bacterium]